MLQGNGIALLEDAFRLQEHPVSAVCSWGLRITNGIVCFGVIPGFPPFCFRGCLFFLFDSSASQTFFFFLSGCSLLLTKEPKKSSISKLTCFHASFFPFCPLSWPPLFVSFSRHLFALSRPSKSALFCRVMGTAQSLKRGMLRVDFARKFGKEIPSRKLREKRSVIREKLRGNN